MDFSALQAFDPAPLQAFAGSTPAMPHIAGDIRFDWTSDTDHEFKDTRKVHRAIDAIGRLPGPNDICHLIVAGQHSLWNMVQAILELAKPVTILSLHTATLGFAAKSVPEMMDLLDTGNIGELVLICSHYFANTSGGIFELATEEFGKRPAKCRLVKAQTHAKILAIKLSDNRTVTIEASANLRSCGAMENATIFGQPSVYQFHRDWIAGIAAKTGE